MRVHVPYKQVLQLILIQLWSLSASIPIIELCDEDRHELWKANSSYLAVTHNITLSCNLHLDNQEKRLMSPKISEQRIKQNSQLQHERNRIKNHVIWLIVVNVEFEYIIDDKWWINWGIPNFIVWVCVQVAASDHAVRVVHIQTWTTPAVLAEPIIFWEGWMAVRGHTEVSRSSRKAIA